MNKVQKKYLFIFLLFFTIFSCSKHHDPIFINTYNEPIAIPSSSSLDGISVKKVSISNIELSQCFEKTSTELNFNSLPSSTNTLTQSVFENTNNPDTYLDKAWAHISNHDSNDKDILSLIEKANFLKPNYNYVYGTYGKFYFFKEDYKQAEYYFIKAIELDRKFYFYYCWLADLYYNLNNYVASEKIALEGLQNVNSKEIDNLRHLYNYLGRAQIWSLKYSEAVETLKKSLNIKNTEYANSNIGLAYIWDKKYDLSIIFFTEAINLSPCNGLNYFWRSLAYKNTKNIVQAKNDAFRYIKLDPDKYSYNHIAEVYYTNKEYDEAKYFFKKSCDLGYKEACGFAK